MGKTKQCDNQAAFRYTWPGRDESYVCVTCAAKLQTVARAIGLYVQLLPIDDGEQCRQQITEESESQ